MQSTLSAYLVSSSIVTLINPHDSIGKVSQCVQAVGSLLQGPESYVLVVRNPERHSLHASRPPLHPGTTAHARCTRSQIRQQKQSGLSLPGMIWL